MTYDRFFNLHIPKTGGTYFRENILNPLVPYMNKNGISTNPEGDGGDKQLAITPTFHWCWYKPFVEENSYIFTTFRDPVKRLISHYAWQAARAIAYDISDYKYEDINVNNFYKWLEKYNDVYKNFQLKNLVYYNEDHSIYTESVHHGWKKDGVPTIESFLFAKDFENFNLDKGQIIKNIKRINMFLKAEDLKSLEVQVGVRDTILYELGLMPIYDEPKTNIYGHENPYSKILFDQFTEKQINDLYDFNSLESEIFFTKSLFRSI